MFKGMSLNAKMMLAPVSLMLVIAVLGGIGYSALNDTAKTFGRVSDESVPNIRFASEMFLNYRRIRISLRTLGLTGISKADAEQAVQDTKDAIAAYEAADKAYVAVGLDDPEEKALYEKLSVAWADFKATGGKVLGLYASGRPEDMAKVYDIFFVECPAKAQVYTAAIHDLNSYHKRNAELWSKEAHEAAQEAKSKILVAIGVGIFAGLGLTIFTLKSVNGLIGSISVVTADLSKGAEEVSEISSSVSEASEKLSSSAAQQAAALQETTAAVEETSAMVRKNAENAQRSAEASVSSQANAEKGKKVVGEMIVSIEEISASNQSIMQQIEASNKEMSDIVAVINEIGNKTKVINDIVFQTKLLSFNASVEAARAGEHGKGFAVVAEEVGNLAAMSGRSAKEITDLLDSSTKRVQEIVANTQTKVEALIAKGSERVNAGIATARNCDTVLDEIVADVQSVGAMVTEIATASQEQSKGIAEINKAINELEAAAQQNSVTSQNAAGSSEQLTQQVKNLRGSIGELGGLVKGGKNAAANAQVIPFAKTVPMQAARKSA
ncbi:MAG: methyl-accepting chemotaxis protein [Bacteriovoracia bacterium]